MKPMMIIALSFFAATAFAKDTANTSTQTTTNTATAATTNMIAKKGKASDAVFMMPSDIQWKAVEGVQGVQMATVEGDATKGHHHNFMKFDAGMSSPAHTHTADHYVTVISGTFILTVDGVEHRLPAGSYFSFKNKKPHATSCAAGAECIIFSDVRGKWDVMPVKTSTISSASSKSSESSTH